MKKVFIILAFLLSFFASRIYAQASLSMNDSMIYLGSNDTLSPGSQITFTAGVYNNSSQVFTGNVTLFNGVDSTGAQGNNPMLLDSNTVFVNFIGPNDTLFYQDTIPIGSEFKNGINTVVIWPVADASTGFSTLDSAKFNVFVFNPLKSQSAGVIDQLVLFPNPFSDKLWLLMMNNLVLEEVRIIDALGRTVLSDKTRNKPFIETADLPQGVYFIELSYNSGLKKRIKTIKQ